jgi:bifunctional DNA-binding transcriptional regulator/antitoxin component of YhaV-PrlF toxin-antitoxin module
MMDLFNRSDAMSPRGFAEGRQAEYETAPGPRSVPYASLRLDSAGRIVVPAAMRAAMLAKAGDTLVAQVVDGELRVVSREWVMRRIDEEAEKFKAANPGVSAVDELIADRREEVRLDEERWARLEREAADIEANRARPADDTRR